MGSNGVRSAASGLTALAWSATVALALGDLTLIAVLIGGDGPFGESAILALVLLAFAVSLAAWTAALAAADRTPLARRPAIAVAAATATGASVVAFWWALFARTTPVPVLVLVPLGLGLAAVWALPAGRRRPALALAGVAALAVAVALPIDAGNSSDRRRVEAELLRSTRQAIETNVGVCVDQVVASAPDADLTGSAGAVGARLAPAVQACLGDRLDGLGRVDCSATTCRWRNEDESIGPTGDVTVGFARRLDALVARRLASGAPA